MRKFQRMTIATLMTGAAMPVAFHNEPGWKMDGDKLALDANGDPIYINNAGAEQSIKHDAIATLQGEARGHRIAKETAEATLKKFEVGGKLIDPETAIKAVDTVKNIDAKKLIDSGEVETLKTQLRDEFTAQLTELKTTNEQLSSTNKSLLIDKQFDGSEFVRERIAVPPDMFRDSFGKHVKIGDDGKVEFYGRDGNRLLSKKNAGEYASGDEAFELLVEQRSDKDQLLRADAAGGSGADGKGGNRGGGRTMRRADFDAMGPVDKAAIAAKVGAGEMTLAD